MLLWFQWRLQFLECGCNVHAVVAVFHKVDMVCCDGRCSAHEGGCSEPPVMAVQLQCHFIWMQCCCSGCRATCSVPERGHSPHAVDAVSKNVHAVCFDGGCSAYEGGCGDSAVIAMHLHCPFSCLQCACRGCSAPFCVSEYECSAHALDAESQMMYVVCCDRGSSAHECGCSDPAVVAVRMQCHFSWMQCPCSRCIATCTGPEFGCSAHAVRKYFVMDYAVPM